MKNDCNYVECPSNTETVRQMFFHGIDTDSAKTMGIVNGSIGLTELTSRAATGDYFQILFATLKK